MTPLEAVQVLERLRADDDIGMRLDVLPGSGGFDWYIGSKTLFTSEAWKAYGTADSFPEAIQRMGDAAARAYPDTRFATWWNERIKH